MNRFNSGARLTYNSLKKIIDHGKDDDFVEGHDDSHHIFTKTIHMRNHLPTRESNRQKYTCAYPECSKQYYELKNWRRHFLKIHTKHEKGDSAKKKKLQKFERKLKKVIQGFLNQFFLKFHFLKPIKLVTLVS